LLNLQTDIINRHNQHKQDNEVDVSGDDVDFITGVFLVEMSNQLSKRDIALIEKITSALDKIDNDRFGSCEECEEEIPMRRLEANPYCTCCVPCAESLEAK